MINQFTIGLTALRAAQFGLSITGQNIANASTPGYHRQMAHLVNRHHRPRQGTAEMDRSQRTVDRHLGIFRQPAGIGVLLIITEQFKKRRRFGLHRAVEHHADYALLVLMHD